MKITFHLSFLTFAQGATRLTNYLEWIAAVSDVIIRDGF
jgi:hypothetical protein